MKSKAYAKKLVKYKIQRDWMIALTVTLTFLLLKVSGHLDWKWVWVVSPIWILLSIYLVLSSLGMAWWFIWGKKSKKKIEEDEVKN